MSRERKAKTLRNDCQVPLIFVLHLTGSLLLLRCAALRSQEISIYTYIHYALVRCYPSTLTHCVFHLTRSLYLCGYTCFDTRALAITLSPFLKNISNKIFDSLFMFAVSVCQTKEAIRNVRASWFILGNHLCTLPALSPSQIVYLLLLGTKYFWPRSASFAHHNGGIYC